MEWPYVMQISQCWVGCSPKPWFPPVPCQGLLLSGFPYPATAVWTPGEEQDRFFGECGSEKCVRIPVLATNNWGLWLHESSSACTFPHCPLSMCEDVLSLLPRPWPPSETRCGGFCAVLTTSLRYSVAMSSPPLAPLGAPSSQCLSLLGPGLFHFLSVDNPVCVLRVTVGWGERPALHRAARR